MLLKCLFLFLLMSDRQEKVAGLDLLNSSTSKIVGISTGIQHLPESYVQSFDRWKVGSTGDLSASLKIEKQHQLKKRPSSLAPRPSLQFRPTLQIMVKGGVPTYVMPGLEFHASGQSSSPQSSPWTAQQWTTFGWAVEPKFRICVFAGKSDGTDELLGKVDEQAIRQALERLGSALQLPEAQPLSTGFHIINLDLEPSPWISLPKGGDNDEEPEILTCLATAELDPREVLSLDAGLAEMTVSTVLQIPLRSPTDSS